MAAFCDMPEIWQSNYTPAKKNEKIVHSQVMLCSHPLLDVELKKNSFLEEKNGIFTKNIIFASISHSLPVAMVTLQRLQKYLCFFLEEKGVACQVING